MVVSKPEKFQPNKSFSLPKRTCGKTTQSFKAEWCELFSWLHYSIDKDAAFCYLCITHSTKGSSSLAPNKTQHLLVEDIPIGKRRQQLSRDIKTVTATKRQLKLLSASHNRYKMLVSS